MKKFSFTLIAVAATVIGVRAASVTSIAGHLAEAVGEDTGATELIVSGSLDARDFKFINEQMPALVSLDLSGATIEAYDSGNAPLFGTTTNYDAATVPPLALFGKRLTSVVLPLNVKAIGLGAFAGCTELTNIAFPEGLDSIAPYAFSGSGLTDVTLPASLKMLGDGAFARCESLASASIAPVASFKVGKDAFYSCTSLTQVSLGEYVSAIGDGAFAGCTGLNGVTFTGGSGSLAEIGIAAFENSGITSFPFAENTALQSVGDWAFAGTQLTTAALPPATHIGQGLFLGNEQLSSATAAQATEIPDYTFADCEALASQDLGNSVTTIGDYAMYNNSSLITLSIPSSTTSIGTQAMAGTVGLQTLNSEAETPPALGDEVWAGVDQPAVTLNVKSNSIDSYQNALQWQDFTIKSSKLRGDVNLDGEVGVADVSAIYNILLGISDDYRETADVNEDGEITVADISAIYNIILGVSSSASPAKPFVHIESNDQLSAPEEVAVDKKKPAMVDVNIDNTADYSSFQLDIDVPQGVIITNVSLGQRVKNHVMGYNEIAKNKYRVVAFSPNNNVIDSDGSLVSLTLELTANDEFNGNDDLVLGNAIFVEANEDSHYINMPTIVRLKQNTVTGIDDIENLNANGPVNVYNTQGQLLRRNVERSTATQGLPSGIYIVGNKKVIVK